MTKKRVFSGIQPSGIIHLGNYLGAILPWVKIQHQFESLFCVVDLHAITVPQNPKELAKNTYQTVAIYLAAGIDPKKSIIFVQSSVPAHTELTWLLNSIAHMGELSRMTQFKDKAGQHEAVEKFIGYYNQLSKTERSGPFLSFLYKIVNGGKELSLKDKDLFNRIGLSIFIESSAKKDTIGAGLFIYPVLMAADILLYQTNIVPIGEDQKQHVELARNLAERFNNRFGKTFIIPEPLISKTGARIMALDNPTRKMSKSDSPASYIALTDRPEIIRKKIMRAVTDSGSTIKFNPKRKGLHNLLTIYQLLSGKTESQIEKHFANKGYGDFKKELAELIITSLAPIQKKIDYHMKNKKLLDKILRDGAKRANKLAQKTLREVKQKIGFV